MTTYKYRLLPTKSQESIFISWLEECRMLHNSLIKQRRDDLTKNGKRFAMFDQIKELPKLKVSYPSLKSVHAQVLQNVVRRVDFSYQMFFKRVKNGEAPGYPRFKGFGRYDSFKYPSFADSKILEDQIKLPRIGFVKFNYHRSIEGNIKTMTVKRKYNKWFIFIVSDHLKTLPTANNNETIGIDVGIENFATLSNGKTIPNNRFYEKKQKSLSKEQRKFDQDKKHNNSVGIKKRAKRVSTIHEKITNSRKDFLNKVSFDLVQEYKNIVVEDLNIKSMTRNCPFSKQILDVGWGYFIIMLIYKAECAGGKLIKINPAYTSQTCSKCGEKTPHSLKERTFNCKCGNSSHRDKNAAQNILALGLQSLAKA